MSKALVGAALLVSTAVVPVVGAPSAHANPSSLFDMTQWTVLSQSAVSRWNDGTGFQYGTYSVATTWQGKSTTPLLVPSVGDVFYVHVYTEVYNVWQASYQMKVLLPAGLHLATITPSTDVFCGVTNFSNVSTRIMPECADPTVFGGYVVFPTVASGINERLHFFFPVVATQPINGGTMQVLSVQSNSPAVSLPNPTLTEHTIYVLAATSSATAPAAPTGLVATPGNGSATVSFVAGSNGGAIISNYQYSLNNGVSWNALSPADGLSPVTIPGLSNGTAYSIRLRGVNSVGAGTASAAVGVTPRTTPAAPTRLVASPRNGAASIAFRPGNNGGAAITNYQYSVNSGAWKPLSPADAASPVRIPGLANGVTYSVRLRAVNAKGPGVASAAVGVRPSATPVVPGAPQFVSVKRGATGTTATVSFWPGSDGGAAITNHQYSLNLGAWKALAPADAASPVAIAGLTSGATYSIRIRAVNVKGAGAASVAVSSTN